jgi:hypothetical protein
MLNIPTHKKHAKTRFIKLYFFITIVMKRFCISLSMFSGVAK